MAVRKKIKKLVQKIEGFKVPVNENTPGYYALDCVVTDEMADVALTLKRRVPTTAETIIKKCGKSREETLRLLEELSRVGVLENIKENGVEVYILQVFIPGILEFMVMNKEQVEKYPQIAKAFSEYVMNIHSKTAASIPVGSPPMRVLPIEKAISVTTETPSYEKLSYWLKKYDYFSVGDCPCRTTARLLGQGCGHLEKDMCIGVGPQAEGLVRSGKARQITYEKTLELLKKAEDNGLVHQVSNIDGSDQLFAICNCCSCGCLGLRGSQYFNAPNASRSNFVAKVETEKCVACGQCVEYCPANAAKLGQKICSSEPVDIPKSLLPDDNLWGPDKWNPDFRHNRKNVVETGTSPCKSECPAHISVQGYVKLAAMGRYTDALALIKKENPLPAVCGRVCPRFCESECTRGNIDEPLAVDEIKKFIADQDLCKDVRYIPPIINHYGKSIAVIGSGPAGISCAYFLAKDGYKVTVFEKHKKLGGMLTLGIPSFRLEKDVINAEIDVLREMEVEFKTNVEVGKNLTLNDLRNQGFEAFYLAVGAQGGRALGIEGEDSKGVVGGIDFLRAVNLGENPQLNGKTIVIGGGNVAIDVARAAIRSKSETVDIYCLETRDEMPALDEEIDEALEENIAINNSWGPKRILSENGRVTGVEFMKCTAVFDENQRFSPKYDENDTVMVEADTVLISVGQTIDWGNLLTGSKVELKPDNTAAADSFTYQTDQPDIFVGGDAYTGPKFAIDAIAAGKEAAISIHRFVWPGQSLTIGRNRREFHYFDKDKVIINGYDNTPRQKIVHTDKGKKAFKDTRLTFTKEQVEKETERCLDCGAAFIDENRCLGCGVCSHKCAFDAITLTRKFDEPLKAIEDLPKNLIKNVVKRGVKIGMKKIKTTIGINRD